MTAVERALTLIFPLAHRELERGASGPNFASARARTSPRSTSRRRGSWAAGVVPLSHQSQQEVLRADPIIEQTARSACFDLGRSASTRSERTAASPATGRSQLG